MITGTAIEARPMRNAPLRKLKTILRGQLARGNSLASPPRPEGHVARQDRFDRLTRADQVVIDVGLDAAVPELADKIIHTLLVGRAKHSRIDGRAPAGLDIAEVGQLLVGELELGVIEQMEDDHVVLLVLKMPEAVQDAIDVVEQVADDDDHPARLD